MKFIKNNFVENSKYIDIHTHILPNIDDGSESVEESINLIYQEMDQGVGTIVLTPHFFPETENHEKFLEKLQNSFELLKKEVNQRNIDIRLISGSEVRISLKLLEMDLTPFCIGNTRYILIELSTSQYYSWTKYVLTGIISRGYIPIIAHIERYDMLPPNEVYEFILIGALIQANFDSIIEKSDYKKVIKRLIKSNYIHLWGSDAHSEIDRPVLIEKGLEYLNRKYKSEYFKRCTFIANNVINDIEINAESVRL